MVNELATLFARLYFDEDTSTRAAQALRIRGYDVLTTQEADQLGATDDEQLAFAVSRGRAIVTHNVQDYPVLHAEYMDQAREHYGIIIIIGQPSIGG